MPTIRAARTVGRVFLLARIDVIVIEFDSISPGAKEMGSRGEVAGSFSDKDESSGAGKASDPRSFLCFDCSVYSDVGEAPDCSPRTH